MRHRTEQIIPGTVGQFLRTPAGGKAAWGPGYFDAIVAPSGGDFATVGAAIAGGKTRIFIKNGTYAETGDLNIPAGGCLISETPGGAILDFGAGAFSVRADGTARSSSTGTFSVAQGATAVVGVGTTFQTDLLAGDWIRLGNIWHEIASITDELNMTLVLAHQGAAISGLAVKAQSMILDICIEGIAIRNSTAQGLEILNTHRLKMASVSVEECGSVSLAGVEMTDSTQLLASGIDIRNSVSQGWLLLRCDNCRFNKSTIQDSNGVGLRVTDCIAVSVNEFFSQHNNAEGVFVDGTSDKCVFGNCIANRNTLEGFETTSTTSSIVFDACTSSLNAGNGIDLDGTENIADACIVKDNTLSGFLGGSACMITNCYVSGNGSNGISASDDENSVIEGNNVINNTGIGISLGDFNQTCVANIVRDNGGDGIQMGAGCLDCLVTGNRITGNTGIGIEILAGATDNVVQDNQVEGNTADSIVDNGTNTRIAVVRHLLFADQLQNPNSADWVVNSLAPLVADSVNAAKKIRQYDDTTEEGAGYPLEIPAIVTKMWITLWSRLESAPTAPNLDVGPRLYNRQTIGDSTAVGAWSAATALNTIVFPAGATGTNFLKSVTTLTLTTLSIVPGREYKFELTRNPGIVNDAVGDWNLELIVVEFF